MVFFPNETIHFYDIQDTETLDLYGNPRKGYQHILSAEVDFQPMTPKDTLKEYGEILEDTYKIYTDINLEITPTMILVLDSDKSQYKITGTPITNNHILETYHKKIIVQKLRKLVTVPEIPEEDNVDDGDVEP